MHWLLDINMGNIYDRIKYSLVIKRIFFNGIFFLIKILCSLYNKNQFKIHRIIKNKNNCYTVIFFYLYKRQILEMRVSDFINNSAIIEKFSSQDAMHIGIAKAFSDIDNN